MQVSDAAAVASTAIAALLLCMRPHAAQEQECISPRTQPYGTKRINCQARSGLLQWAACGCTGGVDEVVDWSKTAPKRKQKRPADSSGDFDDKVSIVE